MAHNDTTWVHEFQILLPLFDKEDSPLSTKYLLCLYKGFNAFSNLGYDYGMPRNWVDMVYSLFVMAAQVYLSALILGTLLNYLVRNNPAEEQHKQTIAALSAHVEEKNIPFDLRDRMLRHFNFQHKKNMGRSAENLWFLPKSLTVKVAYHKYQSTMDKCALEGNAFYGCEQAFLDDCLARLKVMHFNPGELLIKKGDLPRELYMVVEGALVVMDDDNRVLTVIRSDVPDMPPYANIAPFLIGVHYHHPLIAGLDGECTTLILTKEDADQLFHAFPAERERIRENILATYALLPNGEDMALTEERKASLEAKGDYAEMREPVRHALKSQRLETLADFEQAVEQGDVDKLRALIAKGVSPNLANYDGRTGLHIACAKGHSKVVESLLDAQADPNIEDRWGRTPKLEAVYFRQKAIIGLLEKQEAEVNEEYLRERLMRQAISGRVEKVRQILEVGGVNVNVGNYDGRTALHFACSHGHEELVDQLLRAKADINAKDRFGGTPLKDCVVSGHALLATILRTRGGVLPDGMGAELICTAAGEGDIQTLKLLFESQENMNTGDYDARCALHLAAAEARILAVSFLLNHTADPNSEDRWGGRPLDDALRGGTLYHMYCGKLIESWGGKPGTLVDDEEKTEALKQVDIKGGLALVQRLTALGFDKRRIERIGEQELLTTFEACMGVVPVVETMKGHAEILADCVEETEECVTTLFHNILMVLDMMSKRLNPNAGLIRTGTVRDLKKMTRVNLWEKVREAKESNLLTQQHLGGGGITLGVSMRGLPRQYSDGDGMQKRANSPHERKPRDESASLSMRCTQLAQAMRNVGEEQEEDDMGADEFEFYASVNGIETDEEEALHEELDRIEAQAERSDELGIGPHKLAANAFLKASTNLMMISESFALLRSLFINPRFGGVGLASTNGRFLGDDGKKEQSRMGGVGEEDPDDTLVTQFDIIRVMDVLSINVCNDDIDAIVEEAETYSLSHSSYVLNKAAARGAPSRTASGEKSKTPSTAKANPSNDTAVPLSAVIAGSQSFRLLVCDMKVNHQLCSLLECRLGDVLSESKMEQLEVVDERAVKEGDLVHPSLENDGKHFFVVRHGFFTAVHPDAVLAEPSKDPKKGRLPVKKKEQKHLQPLQVKKGDVFGAFGALKPGLIEREVKATSDAVVLVVTSDSLREVIGEDVVLSMELQKLMAESPLDDKEDEDAAVAPRGLMRSASLRKVRDNMASAFRSNKLKDLQGDDGWGALGLKEENSPNLVTRVPSATSSSSLGGGNSLVRGGGWLRAGSAENSASPKLSPRAWEKPGGGDQGTMVGEIQRRGLSETMAILEDLWMCLTMGHSFIARPLLEVVGQGLGEASSHAFEQIFFPPNRELEHLLLEDEFWRCWLVFTAEQGLEDADEDEALTPRRRRDEDEEDEEEEEEEVQVDEAAKQQQETLMESLIARFSPARSLKRRFFEPAVIDQYEPAYLQITGDLKVALPMDKVPELLASVFDDVPFRISRHNAREFLAAFSSDHAAGVTWADIRSVLKKRRMTVQEQEHGLLLGNALDPRNKPLKVWGYVTMVVAVYYVATVPVRAAFLPWDDMLHVIPLATDLPVDVLTTLNFIVALNTAYRNRRSAWITSRFRIAKKLPLSLWCSAVPLDWLAWLAGANNEVACFCRLPRLGLILAKRGQQQSRDKGVRSQIERMLTMVAITVHFAACIWFFLGRSYHKWVSADWAVSWYRVHPSIAHLTYQRDAYGWNAAATVWDQYLFSVHWVAATLTVNGLVGPVIPQNGVELVFCILLMVLNMTLFRWIIGEISSIIMNADMHNVKRREEYAQYKSFIDANNLPDDLRDEIMAHFNASHRDSMVAMKRVLANLCASLQVDRARFLYREIVGNITVFGGCSDSFLDALCVAVSEVHFNPEEPIFEVNAQAAELNMIVVGSVETFVPSEKGEIQDGFHEEGSAPGVLAFFFDTKHLNMGRAGKTGATCLRLTRAQFSDILLLFPADEAAIANNVLTQLKKENKAMSMGYAHSVTQSVNSRAQRSVAASSMNNRSTKGSQAGSRTSRAAGSQAGSRAGGSQVGSRAEKDSKSVNMDLEIQDKDDAESNDPADAPDAELERRVAAKQGRKFKLLLQQRKTRFIHMLHSAAHAGDQQRVEEILSSTPDVAINDPDAQGRTALHIAAGEGHAAVVEFLVEAGGDVSVQDKNGNTPLNDAVRHGKDAVAKFLRDKFPWLKLKLDESEAADKLCKLAQGRATSEIRRLVENGIHVNARNVDGRTALMVAACEGFADVVQLLVTNKADPDLTDRWGKTAMAGAITEDRQEVQEVLRDNGVKHGKGEMELTVAMCEVASINDLKTMRVMVKNGVDPSLGDYDMRTPLHLAASNQCLTVLEFLLNFEPKINVNPIDRFGGTPLEDAYRHGNTAAIELLEARGGLRKDDPSQSRAMAEQLADIQVMQKKQRQPKVEEAAASSLEEQAAKCLSQTVVPAVMHGSTGLVLALTKVLEGFKAVMRAGQRSKTGPLAGTNVGAKKKWNLVMGGVDINAAKLASSTVAEGDEEAEEVTLTKMRPVPRRRASASVPAHDGEVRDVLVGQRSLSPPAVDAPAQPAAAGGQETPEKAAEAAVEAAAATEVAAAMQEEEDAAAAATKEVADAMAEDEEAAVSTAALASGKPPTALAAPAQLAASPPEEAAAAEVAPAAAAAAEADAPPSPPPSSAPPPPSSDAPPPPAPLPPPEDAAAAPAPLAPPSPPPNLLEKETSASAAAPPPPSLDSHPALKPTPPSSAASNAAPPRRSIRADASSSSSKPPPTAGPRPPSPPAPGQQPSASAAAALPGSEQLRAATSPEVAALAPPPPAETPSRPVRKPPSNPPSSHAPSRPFSPPAASTAARAESRNQRRRSREAAQGTTSATVVGAHFGAADADPAPEPAPSAAAEEAASDMVQPFEAGGAEGAAAASEEGGMQVVLPGMAEAPPTESRRRRSVAEDAEGNLLPLSKNNEIEVVEEKRERKLRRTIPGGCEVEYENLEEGLEKLLDLLKEMKLAIITMRHHISQDAGEMDEAENQNAELSMEWMQTSRAWLLVSRRYRTSAATFKRQLSICMLMYKLARRVIKEVRRLLQRSRVHENQLRARGRRKSSSQSAS